MPETSGQVRSARPAARWGWRLGLAVVVGVLAGMAAALLEWCIEVGLEHGAARFAHLSGGEVGHFEWGILLLPAGGGLVAGLLVHALARRGEGQGVELLTHAFHHNLGRMPLRGPGVKGGGAALVIACGGSAGPEGPIAALGAAIGSSMGRFLPITPHERRILLVAGCAAGIGAIFRCPLGGALFATGILYSEPDFESDAIVPAFVASVIGYSVYMLLCGFEGPMLQGVGALKFKSPFDLAWYALLGPLCGLAAIFFSFCLRTVEHRLVPRSPLPTWLNPAVGGLAVGALACVLPQVMDARLDFFQNALDGHLWETQPDRTWTVWVVLFGLVLVGKCVATALTVGTGAPGGVLGPSVFIGGAAGAFLGAVGHALFPETFNEEVRQALIPVGMAGVLAATMRTPLAAIVMVTEMTGSYGLIAPLMLVCVTSYLVGRKWGLNEEQVRTAADSPAHTADPIIHLLESWRVRDLMSTVWPTKVHSDAPLEEVVAGFEPGTRPVVAVVDEGELRGVISTTDLGGAIESPHVAQILVASDLMTPTSHLITLTPDDDIYYALSYFKRFEHDVVPVFEHGQWVGMLARQELGERLRSELAAHHSAAMREHADLAALDRDLDINRMLPGLTAHAANIQRLFVPMEAVGKSLRECRFRDRFEMQIIAIELRDGTLLCPPDPDIPLKTEHRLIAVR